MSDAIHTHYSNLSVAEDAPVEVITASLNALTAKYSEESYPGDAEATRIRRVLLTSYYVLVSPVERRKHDQWIQARRNATLTATIDPTLSPARNADSVQRYESGGAAATATADTQASTPFALTQPVSWPTRHATTTQTRVTNVPIATRRSDGVGKSFLLAVGAAVAALLLWVLWPRSLPEPSVAQVSAPDVAAIIPTRANGILNPETATAAAPPATFGLPLAGEMVVKIGHVGPTSGQIAHLGKDNENGARLAIYEANAKGMMIDGKTVKFELITEDDAADGKQAMQVAQKLMAAKVVGVIGHLNSGTSIPASAIYNAAGVAQISPSATNPRLTNQGFKGVFRMVANDVAQAAAIGNFAVKGMGGKRIAIIDDKTAYGVGLADEAEKAVKAAGSAIVIREALADEKERDFRGVLTKVMAMNADVIVFGGMDAQAGPMLKQMKALRIKAKFISGDGSQSAELIKLGGDASEGAFATTAGVPKEKMPQGAAFYDKFKAKFNADVQVYAPFAYDATNVLIAAIGKVGTDPAKIIDAIKRTSMNGVTGKIAFDAKGDIKDGAVTVFVVKRGLWETVSLVGGPIADAASVVFSGVTANYATAAMTTNLRNGPTAKSTVIRALERATPVQRVAIDGSFVKVQLADGSLGWIAEELLLPKDDVERLRALEADGYVAARSAQDRVGQVDRALKPLFDRDGIRLIEMLHTRNPGAALILKNLASEKVAAPVPDEAAANWYTLAATAARNSSDLQTALSNYQAALVAAPNVGAHHSAVALAAYETGNFSLLLSRAWRAILLSPESTNSCLVLGLGLATASSAERPTGEAASGAFLLALRYSRDVNFTKRYLRGVAAKASNATVAAAIERALVESAVAQ